MERVRYVSFEVALYGDIDIVQAQDAIREFCQKEEWGTTDYSSSVDVEIIEHTQHCSPQLCGNEDETLHQRDAVSW